ncbi:unknown [Clostridium sp. CAG:967]|nr:unknown [Clostridium sp. CAG:967]
MSKMLEGIKTIYSGNNVLNKHIQLFSLCGIIGIMAGYLSLVTQGINEIKPLDKGVIIIVQIIWLLFFTGFETIFLHQKSLPEIDMSSFRAALRKIPLIVFAIGLIFLLVTDFNASYQYFLLSLEIIIGVPLTMFQAGYAQNYKDNDYKKYFQKFRVKEYFFLLIKRIWVIFSCYVTALMTTFFIFVIVGFIMAAVNIAKGGDLASVILLITSNQTALAKLSTYISTVLLIYLLSVGVLVWDYELISTYERED